MGYYFIDKYSLLHFTVGIIWNYLGFDLISLIVLHTIFEYAENTKAGMKFINVHFKLWPGGKEHADSFINSVSDILFSILGWMFYQKYYYKIGKNELGIIAISNILFYWLSDFQILISLLVTMLILTIINKIRFIPYILIGISGGYLISYIDYKLELFS